MAKYSTDPRKGRKMIINTHMILSFPWNSLVSTLTRARSGRRITKRIMNNMRKNPPNRNIKGDIRAGFNFY
jgi:hypothetical protein